MTRHVPDGCPRCEAARRDTQRIRDEVRDRIDTSKSDVHERVLYWLAHEHPDEVREAFDVEES